jgi:hypothetical protein
MQEKALCSPSSRDPRRSLQRGLLRAGHLAILKETSPAGMRVLAQKAVGIRTDTRTSSGSGNAPYLCPCFLIQRLLPSASRTVQLRISSRYLQNAVRSCASCSRHEPPTHRHDGRRHRQWGVLPISARTTSPANIVRMWATDE